uniref:Endonuclease/exonuclease/phosphatase domain-containing protein n=1 Tax=Ascaris lumbricoides TaxID=6252 RepID=A0A9J2PJD4_ASCLU
MWFHHLLPLLHVLFSAVECLPNSQNDFTVMTFNTWQSGKNVENGLFKVAKHISYVYPDIVALQEIENETVIGQLIKMLGRRWSGVANNYSYPDTAILTRHPIINNSIATTARSVGAKILLPIHNRTVQIYSLHLDYRSYGPYAANNKLVSYATQIMAGERNIDGNGRFENMREFILDDGFRKAVKRSKEEPLLVCGDFNAPSHLDWTEETKDLHGGWVFDWPATKMLQGEAAMEDSFRKLHPNPLLKTGNTWSTVEKTTSAGWGWTIPEPQDRIDFIFYKSPLLEPINSYTYQGRDVVWPKPYHWHNDYPSDHFAVVTKFTIS